MERAPHGRLGGAASACLRRHGRYRLLWYRFSQNASLSFSLPLWSFNSILAGEGMPGTAGFCGRTGGWWNCSQVDPAGLAGSNVTVLPMVRYIHCLFLSRALSLARAFSLALTPLKLSTSCSAIPLTCTARQNTYDDRDGCWYSAVGAVHATVPASNRGVGLSTCRGANCSLATYMDRDALQKRFAMLETLNINRIALFGGNLFTALGEYVPLLQKFLQGEGVPGPEGGGIPPFSPGCW